MIQTPTRLPSHSDRRLPAGVITVASAPAGHPYVARIAASAGVALLPDPAVPGADEGVWWPPRVLDPEWIRRNRSAAQILHIHFGTESYSPDQLASTIAAARRVGWPVVFTAHDLEHPQLGDQTRYSDQLDVLMRGADAVTTLTDGAAAIIAQRWDVQALVIPHPSVLSPNTFISPVPTSAAVTIGLHLKDLRPNVDGPGTVRTLLESAERMRAAGVPAVTEIRLHHRVRDESARDDVRRLCAADDHARLIEHARLSDTELATALSGLDACVLPYRHGTHSGWLELCWDLGVPVAAPTVGHYAEQHSDGSVASYAPGDTAALTDALTMLVTTATRAGTPERIAVHDARLEARRESDALASATHADLYRRLIGASA